MAWIRAVVLLALVALIGLAAASYHRPGSVPQTTDLAPAVSQDVFRADLAQTLADLAHADAAHREAWFAQGYGYDLTTLADEGSLPGPGALSFSADAQAYLDAAYAGPAGDYVSAPPAGWQAGYALIRSDLNALAAANGLPQVPAPPYPISGLPIPVHPWSMIMTMTGLSPASSAKSGGGTTVSYSTSSTGAHSQTVTTKVKNGNATTTTTNKTSVSATGKITQTHTVTTSG